MTLRKIPAITMNCDLKADFATSPKDLERYQPLMMDESREDDHRITIMDVIGEDFFGGVSSRQISAALRRVGDNDVRVTVNSPGGNYFEGLAIYNLLREHPFKVTIEVVGMAASAASVIAMAGDEIRIAKAGFLMIHNVWTVAMGDKNEMREAADLMEGV